MKRLSIALSALFLSGAAMATTIGMSTHPFSIKKQVITTEFTSYNSNGAGAGINARYLNKINEQINVDAGFGISDGERASRLFAGFDYELFPDYGRQPRTSIKALIETADFNGDRLNSFGIAPTISKGFAFWGREAFPFLSLPTRVSLNADENTFETQVALAAGITGRLPIGGYDQLLGNIETNFSLRNSYTSIVMGISLPLQ
jgi:hypothetical protein